MATRVKKTKLTVDRLVKYMAKGYEIVLPRIHHNIVYAKPATEVYAHVNGGVVVVDRPVKDHYAYRKQA